MISPSAEHWIRARMPLCRCGHQWGDHARPAHVDADVDDGKRPCIGSCDDCRCPNYQESPSAEQIREKLKIIEQQFRFAFTQRPEDYDGCPSLAGEMADAVAAASTLLASLSQELERIRTEHEDLLARSGKPDADRDFSIHAPTDGEG
jgi:hypothetical protein